MRRRWAAVVFAALLLGACQKIAQLGGEGTWWNKRGYASQVYARRGNVELKLYTKGGSPGGAPAVLLFHGGGWMGGTPRELQPLGDFLVSKGFGVAIAAYRTREGHGTDPADAIDDAVTAFDHVVRQAPQLGFDARRIAVAGGSAGGHLAFFVGRRRLQASPRPHRVVLLSAVVDTSPEGYHPAELGELAAPLSPLDHLVAGLPPTLVVHSKSDDVCPAGGAERLVARSRDLGNTIDAIYADHAGHGFYTDAHTARSVALSEGRFYPAVVSEFLSAPLAEEVGRPR